MGILIGMDEAGYGPNLGPLVVAATAWEVRDEGLGFRVQESIGGEPASAGRRSGTGSDRAGAFASASTPTTDLLRRPVYGDIPRGREIDLYDALREIVRREPGTADHIAIADSKTLYRTGLGLAQLERGVHAALAALGWPADQWSTLVDVLAADPHRQRHCLPWHGDFDCPLPVDDTADEVTALGTRLDETCTTAGVRPVAMRARFVFPAEFNQLTERYGSKGAALSHVTIGLLRELQGTRAGAEETSPPAEPGASLSSPVPCPPTPTLVVCDKHGGRNRYAGLLQHFFPDQWIETLLESRAESRYHWGAPESGVEIAFRRRGEASLPVALASMTAKYLRELAMRALNQFWRARVPGLRPTAGYPLDARRFKAQIAQVQRSLGIDDHVLWRNR